MNHLNLWLQPRRYEPGQLVTIYEHNTIWRGEIKYINYSDETVNVKTKIADKAHTVKLHMEDTLKIEVHGYPK